MADKIEIDVIARTDTVGPKLREVRETIRDTMRSIEKETATTGAASPANLAALEKLKKALLDGVKPLHGQGAMGELHGLEEALHVLERPLRRPASASATCEEYHSSPAPVSPRSARRSVVPCWST